MTSISTLSQKMSVSDSQKRITDILSRQKQVLKKFNDEMAMLNTEMVYILQCSQNDDDIAKAFIK
jgi:hypothetical protein